MLAMVPTAMLVPLAVSAGAARAADMPAVAPPPVLTSDWASTITHTLQFEGGIIGNPDNPASHRNFGQLYTDISNEPILNQALATLMRPVDETKAYDVGFNLQALLGTDSRYDPTLGIFDYALAGRYGPIFVNANVTIHTPFFGSGSVDTKIGLYPGALGFETTDPSTRPFYTLSYVTNFLVPFETVGFLSTWHVNPTIDLYGGVDAGNEVTPWKDNNREPAGYFGFGLNNLLHDKLTVLALSRIGPEDAVRAFGPPANRYLRFWNDVVLTYKATDKLTFVGEANYFKDQGIRSATGQEATAFGFDGYTAYAFNDQVTGNLRGEIYRDNTGLLTTSFLTNTGFTNGIAGYPDYVQNAPPTTYGAVTANLVIKPTFLNTKDYKVTFRPEIRYDSSLNGTRPFDDLTKHDQVLIATDVIVAF